MAFAGKITIQWLKFVFDLCQFGRWNLGTRSGLNFIILSRSTASSSPRIPVTSIVQHFHIVRNNASLAFLLSVQLTPDIKMSINRHRYNTHINMSKPYIVSICGFVILGLLLLPTTSHALCLLLLLSWKHTVVSNVFAIHEPNSRPFGCELSNLRKEKQNKTIY